MINIDFYYVINGVINIVLHSDVEDKIEKKVGKEGKEIK